MAIRSNRLRQQIWAGALIGALAAFVVGMTGQWLLWLQTGPGVKSTGATQGIDLWSYYSMARAVWRSPNGLTYAYPYELFWPTPPIVFQLPITILAWLGKATGLPAAFEIGRIAGGAGAGAAIGAIGTLFPRGFWRRWFYIAAVIGGGFFGLAAIKTAIDNAGLDGLTEPYQYQPTVEGRMFWWLPYLARNLRMPLECLYHAMVIGALACVVWRRHGWAWLLGAIAWMSNPFAAVALHCAVVPWYLWRAVETSGHARRRFAGYLCAWFAVNAAAVVYYVWFLNRWPLLRELNRLYRIQFVPALDLEHLLLMTMPYGAALVATALIGSLRRNIWGRPVWRLFAILAVAHLVLIQQSAFLGEKSMQAYHYNRGYLHLGLVVVAWRVIIICLHKYRGLCLNQTTGVWWPWRITGLRCRVAAVITCGIVSLTCLDQLFFAMYVVFQERGAGLVSTDYAVLVRALPPVPAPAVVLTEPLVTRGSYVTAFSPHIAFNAEETMIVPFPKKRITMLNEAMTDKGGGVVGLGITYAILSKENDQWLKDLNAQGWKQLRESGRLILLKAPQRTPSK